MIPARGPAGVALPMIDTALVKRLVGRQFPHWQGLPVTPVARQGWDNRCFRLGDALLVRLPAAAPYAGQVAFEQRWLPWLAARLPLPVPAPVARGAPDADYPFDWSIYRWIDGTPLAGTAVADPAALAISLAGFLNALHALPGGVGTTAGPRNFHRGGDLHIYDGEVRAALMRLANPALRDAAARCWAAALASPWRDPAVWLHGDIAPGNLLVADGRLAAVIDFGNAATGDPACDLAIAWRGFDATMRAAFRDRIALGDAAWARGRGWALWKALVITTGIAGAAPAEVAAAPTQLAAMLADD